VVRLSSPTIDLGGWIEILVDDDHFGEWRRWISFLSKFTLISSVETLNFLNKSPKEHVDGRICQQKTKTYLWNEFYIASIDQA